MPLTYSNPVYAGALADPFVLRHAGAYYAYGTGNQTEADGRHFPVLRSDDFAQWHFVGGALVPWSREPMAYWAPEVAVRGGRFYLYYSAGLEARDETHRLRVAMADHPAGPFIDAGPVRIGGLMGDAFCIDASPFRDPNGGQWYLFFAADFFANGRVGTGTMGVRLAEDMLTTQGEPLTLLRPSADWQIYERERFHYGRNWEAWHTIEGPFVWYRKGAYYCFYSGGNWRNETYGVGYGVADHPLGPYRDEWNAEGPAVLRASAGRMLGPGHNSIALGPDGITEFMVYHAWDADRTARRMCIDPLAWMRDENGGPDRPRCIGPTTGPRPLL